MEAMILAAGAGTRLRPLTNHVPKAMVKVGGRPLLAWVMDRLVQAGATRVIVNTHYHEDQVRLFLREIAPPNVEVVISPEPDGPYDTGGGLFAAASLFREAEPILLHNVDVLSNIPLDGLLAAHHEQRTRLGDTLVASVAVRTQEAKRRLLFDDRGLMGWENRGSDRAPEGSHQVRVPVGEIRRRSFTGIQVVEPSIFRLSHRGGTFSIVALYLELAAQGYITVPIDVSDHEWVDVGTHERLEEANRMLPLGGSGAS